MDDDEPTPPHEAGRAAGVRGEEEERDLPRVPPALLGVHRQRRRSHEDEVGHGQHQGSGEFKLVRAWDSFSERPRLVLWRVLLKGDPARGGRSNTEALMNIMP